MTCRHCGLAIQDGPAVHICGDTCRATFDGMSIAACDTVFAAYDALDEHIAELIDQGLLPGPLQFEDEAAAVLEAEAVMTITYIAHYSTGDATETLDLDSASPAARAMLRTLARITDDGRRSLPVRDDVFPVTILRVKEAQP